MFIVEYLISTVHCKPYFYPYRPSVDIIQLWVIQGIVLLPQLL
jgi:hypothetical protein